MSRTRFGARQAAAPVPLRQRKQEAVSAAICEAAIDLFAEKGYDETTIDEIADRAGISRRSFFRYFSSKSDVMASGIGAYSAALAGAIGGCPAGSAVADVIRHTVVQVAQRCTAFPQTRKVMQVVARYPAAREALNSRTTELRECVAAAFAARGGAFRRLPPGVLADLTLAVLSVVLHCWFTETEQDIGATAGEVLGTLGAMTGAVGELTPPAAGPAPGASASG